MQEQKWTPGQDLFIESFSPENRHGVIFEDDGEAAYFYAVEKDEQGEGLRVLDALHIHEEDGPEETHGSEELQETEEDEETEEEEDEDHEPADLKILWSRDWQKCALVLDGFVHALFDFENQGGYNLNEFPPPNEFWTKSDRKLSPEIIQRFF